MIRLLSWQDGRAVITETPMICSRRQARLALGEAACAVMDAAVDDLALPWAMRDAIKSATVWDRAAPEIDELAWILDLVPAEIDALFAKAMAI
jgi:hypothetical protein